MMLYRWMDEQKTYGCMDTLIEKRCLYGWMNRKNYEWMGEQKKTMDEQKNDGYMGG